MQEHKIRNLNSREKVKKGNNKTERKRLYQEKEQPWGNRVTEKRPTRSPCSWAFPLGWQEGKH